MNSSRVFKIGKITDTSILYLTGLLWKGQKWCWLINRNLVRTTTSPIIFCDTTCCELVVWLKSNVIKLIAIFLLNVLFKLESICLMHPVYNSLEMLHLQCKRRFLNLTFFFELLIWSIYSYSYSSRNLMSEASIGRILKCSVDSSSSLQDEHVSP